VSELAYRRSSRPGEEYRWKISVDKNLCIGSAMCVAIAPDRFVLDERQRSGPVEAEI
jgi:ferredoxin